MNLDLLEYFHRELKFLQSQGPQFANEYPDIGPLLTAPSRDTADPHVERLIQAFAWLNARVHLHIDRDLREIAEYLFSVVFPHAQRPFPACAVVQLAPRIPEQLPPEGTTVPRGTLLESDQVRGMQCRFQTCFPVTIRPIELTEVHLQRLKVDAAPSFVPAARSVLSLDVRSLTSGCGIRLGPTPLRVFLQGSRTTSFPLYEILVRDSIGVAIVDAEGQRTELPGRGLVLGVGFQPDESLLYTDARSQSGHGLLLDFFAFPEKFLFVDVCGLDRLDTTDLGEKARVEIYCSRSHRELEKLVSKSNVGLHCAPIVNLFSMRTEPVALTHDRAEYPVVPDARFPDQFEIYSIDRVFAVSADRVIRIPRLYEPRQPHDTDHCNAAWISQRRSRRQSLSGMWVSLADPAGQFLAVDRWTLDIEATCTNADMPASLPFHGDGPQLKLPNRSMFDARCVVPPTRRADPPLLQWGHGKLVAMLAFQSLPLVCESSSVTKRLQDFLRVWSPSGVREAVGFTECLVAAEARQILEEVWVETHRCFARGVEVTVDLDESRSPGSSAFLFATVLEQFLAVTSAINCFTRVVAKSSETHRTICRFPVRAGHQTLASLT